MAVLGAAWPRLCLRLAVASAAWPLVMLGQAAGGQGGAAAAGKRSFRFVHLSDPHCARATRNPPVRFLFDPHRKDLVRSFDLLESAVRQINEQVRPDFVVVTGDLVDRRGDLESLRRVKAILAQLHCPWYPVIGDHDDRRSWTRVFGTGRLNYTFRHGGWRFLALDSSLGKLDGPTLAWLRAQLEADAAVPTALLLHRPLVLLKAHVVAARKIYGARLLLTNAAEARALLARHRNVRAVFAGHCHVPVHCESGRVSHFVAPALVELGHHFAVVEVSGPSVRVTHCAVRREGEKAAR